MAGITSVNQEARLPERRGLRRGGRLEESEGTAQMSTGEKIVR